MDMQYPAGVLLRLAARAMREVPPEYMRLNKVKAIMALADVIEDRGRNLSPDAFVTAVDILRSVSALSRDLMHLPPRADYLIRDLIEIPRDLYEVAPLKRRKEWIDEELNLSAELAAS